MNHSTFDFSKNKDTSMTRTFIQDFTYIEHTIIQCTVPSFPCYIYFLPRKCLVPIYNTEFIPVLYLQSKSISSQLLIVWTYMFSKTGHLPSHCQNSFSRSNTSLFPQLWQIFYKRIFCQNSFSRTSKLSTLPQLLQWIL